jgi:hypothetical protein
MLERNPDPNLRVLVVWEPILTTDWRPPGRWALARITDRRARQFWDPKHLVALELGRSAKEKPGQPEPTCCEDHGFFWDLAVVYAPHSPWRSMPRAVFWNGPVYKVLPNLEKALHNLPR